MSRLAQNLAGWGDDWIICLDCGGTGCGECDGEGGWPASATRFDDEPATSDPVSHSYRDKAA